MGDFGAAVIGAGSWGTVISHLAASSGTPTLIWSHETEVAEEINRRGTNRDYHSSLQLDESVTATSDLDDLDDVEGPFFLAVPSKFLPGIKEDLLTTLYGKSWVSLVKGLVRGEETVTNFLGRAGERRAVMAGPNLSSEIARGEPAAAVVACKDQEFAESVQKLFRSTNLRVYRSTDVTGVEIGGVVKNIIAIAAGVLDGLGMGYNAKAALLTRGLAELSRFAHRIGAERRTLTGLAGLGDMIATASSPDSRNYTVGTRLARGEEIEEIVASMEQVAEGVETAGMLLEWADAVGVEMPICAAVHKILERELTPEEALEALMERPLKREFHR